MPLTLALGKERGVVNFNLSREYMSESYDQARRYGSKWLIVERLVGFCFILLGVGLYIYANGKTVLPVALVAIGVFELFSNQIRKYLWLRRHSKSKLMNAEVELVVTEAGIDSKGPFSNGHFEWSGIEKAIRTPNGILVWPQKGMYWYLPERKAGRETIDFIQSKIA
jgi:hypothetical protein